MTTSVRYGLLAGLLLVGITSLVWFLFGTSLSYQTAELVGYATILLGLSMVVFGVRAEREVQSPYTFIDAFKTGLVIALIAAAFYFLYNVGFFWLKGDEFWTYTNDQMRQTMSAADYLRYQQDFNANRDTYLNPLVQGSIMFATVFVLGAIVAAGSAWAFKKR